MLLYNTSCWHELYSSNAGHCKLQLFFFLLLFLLNSCSQLLSSFMFSVSVQAGNQTLASRGRWRRSCIAHLHVMLVSQWSNSGINLDAHLWPAVRVKACAIAWSCLVFLCSFVSFAAMKSAQCRYRSATVAQHEFRKSTEMLISIRRLFYSGLVPEIIQEIKTDLIKIQLRFQEAHWDLSARPL